MNGIACIVPNATIENLANKMGKTVRLTSTLVSSWQSVNNTSDYPTYEELKEFYDSRKPSHKDLTRISQNNNYIKLNRDFSPTLRHDRAVNIARMFSDIVDEEIGKKLEEIDTTLSETDNPETIANLSQKRKDYETYKGRQAAIKEITLTKIISQIENVYRNYANKPRKELAAIYGEDKVDYIINEYNKIVDNFPALFDEACPIIEANESIRLVTDYHNFNNGSEETVVFGGESYEDNQTIESDNEASDDDEAMDRATGNEGWNYKVRFTDPYSTLSRDVKKVLSSIVRTDNNGNIDVDDLGNPRYLNPEYTHVVLLNELSGMIDSDDFMTSDGRFPALEKAAEKYPWINQIISTLVIDENLRGSFFSDLRKDFIPYWNQHIDKDGKQITQSLNTITAAESMYNAIESTYSERTLLDVDSLYTRAGKISADKAKIGKELADKTLFRIRDFNEKDFDSIVNNVTKILNMVGVATNKNMVTNMLKSDEGISNLKDVIYDVQKIFTDSQTIAEDTDLIEQFKEQYKNISDRMGVVDEFDSIASFRDGDKTRYSYSTPNYIDTTIKKFKSDERRQAFLDEEFGAYEWFKKDGKWRNNWLRLIEEDEDVRQHLSTKELTSINGISYTQWRPEDIRTAFINEYFSIPINKGAAHQYAWYNMPIFSDSPVVKFIRFVRYTDNYKEQLIPLLRNVVKQEIYRINLVNRRYEEGVEPIQNFDKTEKSNGGAEFKFFPELNNGEFLNQALALTEAKDVTALNALIDSNITNVMNSLFENFMTNSTSVLNIETILKKNNSIDANANIQDKLEEYFWNQVYASTQIIQLTTTDLAFYKNGVDFQKRYKEVYASGMKLNTNTRYGKKTRNTLYLADDVITSNVYNDIKDTMNKAVEQGLIQSYDRDNILNKFKEVNVADAQAYVSPEAMRSILDMMGKWTDEMEAAYDRIKHGEFDMGDFNIIWQTLKPFVFTQLRKPDGFGKYIKVPHQNKNSEFLLLAAYGLVANSLDASPQLKALQKYMTDNKIDVIQFQSAVKAGGQGIIDINYSETKLEKALTPEILKAAESALGKKFTTASDIDKFTKGTTRMLETGKLSQEAFNDLTNSILPTEEDVYKALDKYAKVNGEFKPEFLHTISYEDYMIQQPVPEHLIDTEAVFGSQLRNLIIADLPEDFSTIIDGKKYNKQELIDFYDSLIVENLLENFTRIKGKVENINTLQEVLLSQVKGNAKYGRDMVNALQIMDVTDSKGNVSQDFKMPLSNPINTLELQKLVTSLFKNNIAKQFIKGGNAVQVSCWGLTDELKIVKENGKLVGLECYMPASSMEFFKAFMIEDNKGNQVLDVKKLHQAGLDKIIGYRIPTEDKYSMAPLIIKGFLPQQNGSAIILPADITTMAGSDFDIDKMFLMLPEFRAKDTVDWYKFKKDAKKAFSNLSKNDIDIIVDEIINGKIEFSEDTPEMDLYDYYVEHKADYTQYKMSKIKYDNTKAPQDNTREQRNNMLIDIIYDVLTHNSTQDKLFNPGGFDGVKVQARISNIINNKEVYDYFCEKYGLNSRQEAITKLLDLSKKQNLDELDSFFKVYSKTHNTEKNVLTLDTFIYNHKQNMTGGALIGMYANNNSAQAKYQHSKLSLKDNRAFRLNGRKIQSLHDVTSELGERISRNCSQMLAASVDNVKDPVLADLMQNQNTAKIMGFMLRAGMSLEEASLMFSQPVIKELFNKYGNISDKSIAAAIRNMQKDLRNRGGLAMLDSVPALDSRLLMNNILVQYELNNLDSEKQNKALAFEIKTLELMYYIVKCASEMSTLTQISRADSPAGGMLNTIGGAKVQVAKVDDVKLRAKEDKYPFIGMEDVIDNTSVTLSMPENQLRTILLDKKMPKLQAFYSLGIQLGVDVLSKFFPQANKYTNAILSEFLEDVPSEYLKDTDTAVRHFNLIYRDLVNYALSNTKMLGNDDEMTYDEKRDYYLNKFPEKFLEIKRDNPDIAKLGIMRKLTVKDGNIIFEKSGRLRQATKDSFMRDMDTLLYMGDTAKNLAEDLIKYAYYQNGLWFSPNGYSNFFSTDFLNAFPEIVNTMRDLNKPMYSEFLSQFYANHPEVTSSFIKVKRLVGQDESAENIIVKLVNVINKYGKPYRYINYNDTTYYLTNYTGTVEEGGEASYTKAPRFTDLRYNMNMNAVDMEAFNDPLRGAKKTINEQFANIEDMLPGDFESVLSELEDTAEFTPLEQYSEDAGENTLDKPICKNTIKLLTDE